jgi:hypothetical protein
MVAEALTATAQNQQIRAAYRMFSVPTFPEACVGAGQTSKLVTQSARLSLRVGTWFPLNSLIITAFDRPGRRIPHVPIAIEVGHEDPPLFNLQAEMISESKLMPVRAGTSRIRARTLCNSPAAAEILISVTTHQ